MISPGYTGFAWLSHRPPLLCVVSGWVARPTGQWATIEMLGGPDGVLVGMGVDGRRTVHPADLHKERSDAEAAGIRAARQEAFSRFGTLVRFRPGPVDESSWPMERQLGLPDLDGHLDMRSRLGLGVVITHATDLDALLVLWSGELPPRMNRAATGRPCLHTLWIPNFELMLADETPT